MTMETELQKSFIWEVDNFSQRKSSIRSPLFSSGGYEWYVLLHPEGDDVEDHLSLYLCVANPKSLHRRCKRRASLRFVILNQSGKEIHKTSEGSELFRAEIPGWGFRKAMPLTKLQDKELLEKNTLIIEVYTKVTEDIRNGYEFGHFFPGRELVDYRGFREQVFYPRRELVDFRGFRVLPSQVILLSRVLAKHPNFAVHIKPMDQKMHTAYINTLLVLIERLDKPIESFSKRELTESYSKLNDLTEKGFKLDWLKSKLDEVSLEWTKENAVVQVQELEEHVGHLEMMVFHLKAELENEKFKSSIDSVKVLSLETTVADLKVELDKEKAKSDTKPKISALEKTAVSDMVVELEKEKAETDTDPLVFSLEKTAVSDIEVELEKEKAKSDTGPLVISSNNDVFFRSRERYGILRRRRSDYGKTD